MRSLTTSGTQRLPRYVKARWFLGHGPLAVPSASITTLRSEAGQV